MSVGLSVEGRLRVVDVLGPRLCRVGCWCAVMLTLVAAGIVLIRHTRPWTGPAGITGVSTFLVVVLGPWAGFAHARLRTPRRLTVGFFLIPAIAVATVLVSISPTPSAVRWSRDQVAFARVDQTVAASRSSEVVYRPMVRDVGSFHVFALFTVNGGHYYVLTNPSQLDSEGCQSGVAHLPGGPQPSVGGLYLRRHLDGAWYGFQACWD